MKRKQIWKIELHLWRHLTEGVEPQPRSNPFAKDGNYYPTEIVFESQPTTADLIAVYEATSWMSVFGDDFPAIIKVPTMPNARNTATATISCDGREIGKVELSFFFIWVK